jgi:hypothetical protein
VAKKAKKSAKKTAKKGISDRGSQRLDRSRTEKHEDACKAEHADATDRNETRTECYFSLQQGDP